MPEAPASNMWGFGEAPEAESPRIFTYKKTDWAPTLRCGVLPCPVEDDGNDCHLHIYVPTFHKLPGGHHGDHIRRSHPFTIYRVPHTGEYMSHMEDLLSSNHGKRSRGQRQPQTTATRDFPGEEMRKSLLTPASPILMSSMGR